MQITDTPAAAPSSDKDTASEKDRAPERDSVPEKDSASGKYRADIDGLRGIAVLAVLFYHANLGCPGGYVGVDVFFVISGYLITSLILREIRDGTFRLALFWERRVRRILPALSALLLGTLGLGWFLLLPTEFKDLCASVAAQAGMLSNVYFWLRSGYFEVASASRPLLHLWSLAVEEQFYVLLPLALLGLSRLGRGATIGGLSTLLGLSFGLNLVGVRWFPEGTYLLLPTRAWELLIGSLAGLLPPPPAGWRWRCEGIAALGLGGLAVAVFAFSKTTVFPGAAALLPCLGTAALIWAGSRPRAGEDGRAGAWGISRLLAGTVLRSVGLISYSLYLWHWPLLVVARLACVRDLTPLERVACLLASVVLASLSYWLIERPFRSRRPQRAAPRRVLATGAACLALFLAAGSAGALSDGLPHRFPASTQRYLEVAAREMPYYLVTPEDVAGERLVEVGGDRTRPVHCLVWGDSHAAALFPGLKRMADQTGKRCVSATYPSTTPLLGFSSHGPASLKERSLPFNAEVVSYAARHRVPHVLIVAFWGSTTFGDVDPATGLTDMHGRFAATVDRLKELGARVWIMKQVPAYPVEIPQALARLSVLDQGTDSVRMTLQHHRWLQAPFDRIIDDMAARGATVLDPVEVLSDGTQRTLVERDGSILYRDSHHLSPEGAMQLSSLFEPIFAEDAGTDRQVRVNRGRDSSLPARGLPNSGQ